MVMGSKVDPLPQQTRNAPVQDSDPSVGVRGLDFTGEAHEEIALRAYRLWEEGGCPIGSPEEDWFRAEEEIRSEALQSELCACRLGARIVRVVNGDRFK